MRSRVAEIDQNAVAHVPTDEAVELGDHPGDGPVICGDDLAQIFGVEARRQRRRADEIAEQDRELTAFGGFGARWSGRGWRSWSRGPNQVAAATTELCDGFVLETAAWA